MSTLYFIAQKDFDELKERFEQLTMMRTTTAEKLLQDYKRIAETRIQGILGSIEDFIIFIAAENLIESLKNENELVKKQQQGDLCPLPFRESGISMASTGEESAPQSIQFLLFNCQKINRQDD